MVDIEETRDPEAHLDHNQDELTDTKEADDMIKVKAMTKGTTDTNMMATVIDIKKEEAIMRSRRRRRAPGGSSTKKIDLTRDSWTGNRIEEAARTVMDLGKDASKEKTESTRRRVKIKL